MRAVLDKMVEWLAPQPFPAQVREPWLPPTLSAAALAAPPGPRIDPSPRPARSTVAEPAPVEALTAAVTSNGQTTSGGPLPLPLSLRPPLRRDFEERAWKAYRHLGAARQAVNWIAHGISRCHLYIGQVQADGAGDPEPIENPGVAGEILTELHDGPIGQADMLKRLAIHLLVPGCSWLAGYPTPLPADQQRETSQPPQLTPQEKEPGEPKTSWAVLSRKEWMDGEGGGIRLKLPNHPDRGGDGWVSFTAEANVVLVPIYDPDPEDAQYATSAFEAALNDCDELTGLSQRVAADIQSRLIGNGIALVAESATMPTPAASSGVNPLRADPFITAINAAARTAIQNPESADARLPIWGKVADESFAGGGPIAHVTFATPFDDQIPILRQDARKTLAADLDIPGSIVTGVEDLNHWSAWAVDDQAVRAHLGPLLTLICTALTIQVLWPALRAAGEADPESQCIWWDATEITMRPDRSQTAIEAHKEGIIGGKAARRDLGFSDEDKPDAEEIEARKPPAPVLPGQQPDAAAGNEQGGQTTPAATPKPPANPGGQPAVNGTRPAAA